MFNIFKKKEVEEESRTVCVRPDYRSNNYLMTDYGTFMVWCADNDKEGTPKDFVEFVKSNEEFDHL